MSRKRTTQGTTLIEILVVIVVFLVGILAIVQVFPGGFKVLNTTRNNTAASILGRSMIERIKGRPDQLPDAIVPVRYRVVGSQIVIEAEPDRFPSDMGPSYDDLRANGGFYDNSGTLIANWQYLVGANVTRRVLGEGKVIPTPRQVGGNFGSLMLLQFAPIVYNPASSYVSLFVVYGNDMTRRDGDPTQGNGFVRPTEFFIDNDDNNNATLYFPGLTKAVDYRINMTIYVNNGTAVDRRDIVDYVLPVPVSPGNYPAPVATMPGLLNAGESLVSIDYDSVRVARTFENVDISNGGVFTDDPYEYKLLSPQLGMILFNPKGYNFMVRRNGGRRDPLLGRVSYDVFDWRILREEFRAPDSSPAQYKLALGSLTVSGEENTDGLRNSGMQFTVPDRNGAAQSVDVVLQDADTGAVYVYDPSNPKDPSPNPNTRNDINVDPTKSSYYVNKSGGIVRLLDYDRDETNGIQLMAIFPGDASPTVTTVTNRNLRVMYQAREQWAVQVLKPSARYSRASGRPGIGQYLVGGNRVYFPPSDAGRMVSLGEIYYINTNGQAVGPNPLTATITANPPDASGLPYIDIPSFFPDFASWDESYGSCVKSVKGASVAVRVLWNPDRFRLTNDTTRNLSEFDKWMQGWRRSTTETYLQRGF